MHREADRVGGLLQLGMNLVVVVRSLSFADVSDIDLRSSPIKKEAVRS